MLKVFACSTKCLIVCLILACAQPALAEDSMYRCGNTFQDTPCKGVVSKPINEKPARKPLVTIHPTPVGKKVAAAKEPATTFQADCKKLGEEAKVIAKLREIGVPENDQLSITTDVAKKTLIKKVYGYSGNAFQIQNAVEKECLQQNQKTTLTSKWMAKAKQLLGFGAGTTKKAKPQTAPKPAPPQIKSTADPKPVTEPSQPEPSTSPPTVQSEPVAPTEPAPVPEPIVAPPEPAPPPTPQVQPEPVAPVATPAPPVAPKEAVQEDSQGMCSALKAGLANIASQKRKGGDAAFMKDLKEQQIELENVMKSAGC